MRLVERNKNIIIFDILERAIRDLRNESNGREKLVPILIFPLIRKCV